MSTERLKSIYQQKLAAHTDEWQAGFWGADEYTHEMVNHLEGYVKGNVTTNGIDNFWSLLKRGIGGTYVSVEPFTSSGMLTNRRFASTTEDR